MFNLMTHIGLSPYAQEEYSLCLSDYVLRVQPIIQETLFNVEKIFLYAKANLSRLDLKIWAHYFLTHPNIVANWQDKDVSLSLSLSPLQDIDELRNLSFWTDHLLGDDLCTIIDLDGEYLDIANKKLIVTHKQTELKITRRTVIFNSLNHDTNYNSKEIFQFLQKWELIFASVSKSLAHQTLDSQVSFKMLSRL